MSTAATLLREAFRAITRHKLRSALTMLGVTIGTSAVVLVLAMASSAAERAQADFDKLGDSLVWIEAGARNMAGVHGAGGSGAR